MMFYKFAKIYLAATLAFAGINALQAQAADIRHTDVSVETTSFETLATYDIFEEERVYTEMDVSVSADLEQSLLIKDSGNKLPKLLMQLVPGLFSSSSNRSQFYSKNLNIDLTESRASDLNISGQDPTSGFKDRFKQLLYLYQKIPSL